MGPGNPALAQETSFLQKLLPGSDAPEASEALQQMLAADVLEIGTLRLPTYELNRFYAARSYKLEWVEKGDLTERSDALMRGVMAEAAVNALPSSRYPVSMLAHLRSNETMPDVQRTALLDVMVSYIAMRYAFDVQNGVTAPRTSLKDKASGSDLLETLAAASDIPRVLQALPPHSTDYKNLQKYYSELRLDTPTELPPVPAGPSLKPSMSDSRLPALRALLIQRGDLNEAEAGDGEEYDTVTQEAVMRFQKRHGLNPDGAVGGLTLAALNATSFSHVPQIAATLERLRWLPHQWPERYVLVNLPGYSLRAVENGKPALEMRVIIGTLKNQTPLFMNVINQVVFNPTWSVPKSIATKEMLAKIRENPDYLAQHNYRLLARGESGTREVDPWDVDWNEMNATHFPYTIRQDAGDDNALGKVKFNIPNSGAIYLHDTASPKLFAKDARALSHGCVRVENPKAMAHFILSTQWDAEKIDTTYDSDQPRTIPVKQPVPVYLVYLTAGIDAEGKPYFYPDIYGQDARLAEKLKI